MKIKTFDSQGKNIEETDFSKEIAGFTPNTVVLDQYVRVYKANKRQGTQSTKTRGEVKGSGAKPWSQKHTGRARVGEKRNPIWRHGGIAHGPKPRDWSLSLSYTLRMLALKSALALKAQEDRVYIVEEIKFDKTSTKEALKFIENTGLTGKILVVTLQKNDKTVKSFNNISGVKLVPVSTVNVYDLLSTNSVLFEKKALSKLEDKVE